MLKFHFLFILFWFFSFLEEYKTMEQLDFHKSITLLNGNIFVIYQKGIIILDSSMNNSSIIEHFDGNCSINEKQKFNKISISRFLEDDYGYVICTINDAIYFFDCEGTILLKKDYKDQLVGYYYSLIPIKRRDKQFEYMICFAKNNNNITLLFFEYDDNVPKSNRITKAFSFVSSSLENNLLSCQLMVNITKSNEIIVCFIGLNNPKNISTFYIDYNSYEKINTIKNAAFEYGNTNGLKSLKTAISSDKTKSLVCLILQSSAYCSIYYAQNNNFSEKKYYMNCKSEYESLNIYYIRESNQYFLLCLKDQSFNIISMNDNFEIIFNCSTPHIATNINSFSIVFSYDLSNHFLLIGYDDNQVSYNHFNFTSTGINATDKRIKNISLYIQEKQNISSNTLPPAKITPATTQILSTTQIILSTIINTLSTDIITQIPVISLPITSITQLAILNTSSTMIISPTSSFINSVSSQSTINSTAISDSLTTVPSILESTVNYKENFISIVSSLININPPSREINQIKVNATKENLIDKISDIIDEIEIGKIYEKKDDDFSIYIYPTNYSHSLSNTHVNFSECEKVLRNHYKIPDSSIMTFLQIELKNDDSNSLINQVEYQAYDGTKKLLDLSLCDDVNINVIYSIKNNTLANFSSASKFKENGIDIFNLNDSFFNDICEPYSESDNDLILEDRIKDIYQNYSLCEEGCTYDKIDFENMTISCECKVKDNISTIINEISYESVKGSSTNFEVIKCYNLVFSLKNKFNNIGFWILGILILAHIPLLLYYYFKGINSIKDYIIEEMKKYGYIKVKKTVNANNNVKNRKIIASRNKNKKSNSPPIKKKITKKIKKKGLTIKNLEIINNSSSLNIIDSRRKGLNLINKNNNDKEVEKKKRKQKKICRVKKGNKKALKIHNLPTQVTTKNKKDKIIQKQPQENKENKNKENFSLININLNLSNKKNKYIPPESNIILNNYTFIEAVKYDKRELMVIIYIFLLAKQIFFHTFLYRSPLELFSLRLCLLIFIISSDLSLNALFYFNSNISKKYRHAKNLFLFALSDNIVVIFLSIIVGFILLTLLSKMGNCVNNIREIFGKEEEKLKNNAKYVVTEKRKKEIFVEIDEIIRKYKTKVLILIIIELMLMLFFWYFVTAFCHVYNATQLSWLLDSFLSILSRAAIEIIISSGFAKLYKISITGTCLYKIVMFLYNFG